MPAPEGNKYAQVWSDEDAIEAFNKALDFALNDNECLCMQDAVFQSGMPSTTFYRFVERGEVWESLKKDMNDAIIRRVNKGSIQNKFNPSASIWRMKQLGETDRTESDTTHRIADVETWASKFRQQSSPTNKSE